MSNVQPHYAHILTNSSLSVVSLHDVPSIIISPKLVVSDRVNSSKTLASMSYMLNPHAKIFVPYSSISKNMNTVNGESSELYELCDIMRENIKLFSSFKYFCVALSYCLYSCICARFSQSGFIYDNFYTDTHINDNSSFLSNSYFNDELSSLDFSIVNTIGNPIANIKDECDPLKILRCLRVSNVNRLIIGHLNINSIRNKFESLKLIMKGIIDILVITESKLDDSFPASQFIIDGYAPPIPS